MKHRELPPIKFTPDGEEPFLTSRPLPFRASVTVIARALMGISFALHRIADVLERER